MRAFRHRRWHLDEVFVKINSVKHYFWRAVDHEGEVLEGFVTKIRNRKAAMKFSENRFAGMAHRRNS